MTRTTPALMIVAQLGGGHAPFVADEVEREGGTWTATGRWKHPSGRLSEPAKTYTWPLRRVVEVRWGWEPPR